MITSKSNKIDIDKLIKDDVELTDKAMVVLTAIVDLHNQGKENITNKDIVKVTDLGIRQVVGVVNGLVKKVDLQRGKARVMVEKEVTILKLSQEE